MPDEGVKFRENDLEKRRSPERGTWGQKTPLNHFKSLPSGFEANPATSGKACRDRQRKGSGKEKGHSLNFCGSLSLIISSNQIKTLLSSLEERQSGAENPPDPPCLMRATPLDTSPSITKAADVGLVPQLVLFFSDVHGQERKGKGPCLCRSDSSSGRP